MPDLMGQSAPRLHSTCLIAQRRRHKARLSPATGIRTKDGSGTLVAPLDIAGPTLPPLPLPLLSLPVLSLPVLPPLRVVT